LAISYLRTIDLLNNDITQKGDKKNLGPPYQYGPSYRSAVCDELNLPT